MQFLSGKEERKEYCLFLLLLFILSLFTTIIYLPEHQLYPGYDIYFHYGRIKALIVAIQDGTFPVYIESEAANGYGYGTKLFYSDFLLLPVALLALVTDLIFAYKVFVFFILFLCGFYTNIAVSRIFNSRYIGYLAAILVTFSYFRLTGLFLRGGISESLSFIFIPVIAWGIYEIIEGNYKKWYIFSIGFALLIMSHLITSLLTAIMVLLVLMINYKKFVKEKKRIYSLLVSGFVVIILSAYGIFPLFEQLSTNVFYQTISKDLNTPAQNKLEIQVIMKGLVTGFFIDKKDSLDYGVGIILVVLVILRVFIRKRNRQIRLADYSLLIGVISIIITSTIFPWGRFPLTLLKSIQYPWRLFEYTTFLFAVSGATYVFYLTKTYKSLLITYSVTVSFIVIQIFVNSYNFRNSKFLNSFAGVEPAVSNLFFLGGLEYTPLKYVLYDYNFWDRIADRKEEIICQNEGTSVSQLIHNKSKVEFFIDTQFLTDSVTVPLFYYVGYEATFKNQDKLEIFQSKDGLLQIPIEGKGDVKINFNGTFIQRYSLYITLLGFLLLIFYIYWIPLINRRNNKK